MKGVKKIRITSISKRRNYYVVSYVIGYVLSLIGKGIQNPLDLFPINIFSFATMVLIGEALYLRDQGALLLVLPFKLIKPLIVIIALIIVFSRVEILMMDMYGINLNFLWGM